MARRGKDPIRIALVEQDADTRLLVRTATDLDPRYHLVGEFDTLADAVPGLLERPVDVVIVHGLEPGPHCCELLAQLRVAVGRARIVIVDPGDVMPVELAVAAGADAFLAPSDFTHVADALQLAAGHLEAAS